MQVRIFDIFLALVPMGPILVFIDATFSRNQYQGEYPYGVTVDPPATSKITRINGIIKMTQKTFSQNLTIKTHEEYLALAGQVLAPVSTKCDTVVNQKNCIQI